MIEILKAILFGIVEGITEWLPISSTGHMIGNLFDNAIEASLKLPPDQRMIRIYMDMKNTQLYISFTNLTAEKKLQFTKRLMESISVMILHISTRKMAIKLQSFWKEPECVIHRTTKMSKGA